MDYNTHSNSYYAGGESHDNGAKLPNQAANSGDMTGPNVISNRIAVIKLKRIAELNNRLKETLRRERIPASNSCLLLIHHIQETPDYLIPYSFKLPVEQNRFLKYQNLKKFKGGSGATNGIGGSGSGSGGGGGGAGCCTIM